MNKQSIFKLTSSTVEILRCYNCKEHEFQDKVYGNKMRVHNKTAKENQYRCTVCTNIRQK